MSEETKNTSNENSNSHETEAHPTQNSKEYFLDKAKLIFQKLQGQTETFVKVGKIKFDQTSLEVQQKKLLQRLGSLVFEKPEAFQLSDEATSIVTQIKDLNEKITAHESQIKDTTNARIKPDSVK